MNNFIHTSNHFTVVHLVTWPLNDREAEADLVLIQTSLLLSCKLNCSNANKGILHDKSSKAFIKAWSPPALLPFLAKIICHEYFCLAKFPQGLMRLEDKYDPKKLMIHS